MRLIGPPFCHVVKLAVTHFKTRGSKVRSLHVSSSYTWSVQSPLRPAVVRPAAARRRLARARDILPFISGRQRVVVGERKAQKWQPPQHNLGRSIVSNTEPTLSYNYIPTARHAQCDRAHRSRRSTANDDRRYRVSPSVVSVYRLRRQDRKSPRTVLTNAPSNRRSISPPGDRSANCGEPTVYAMGSQRARTADEELYGQRITKNYQAKDREGNGTTGNVRRGAEMQLPADIAL